MRLVVFFLPLMITCFQVFALSSEQKAERLALIENLKSNGETVYAMVPKNVDEAFFDQVAQGCQAAAQNLNVHCIYFGSAIENMRLQLQDILSLIDAGVDGLAIAGIKEGWLAQKLANRLKSWAKPVIAFDSPLNKSIAQAYVGTNNYALGRVLGREVKKLRPGGGSYCIQTERPDSPNHQNRVKGIIDGLTDNKQQEDKWTVVFGCPVEHYGDFERATRQMVRIIGDSRPDVFINTGGGPQFLPQSYRKAISPYKEDLKTGKLIIANIDAIPEQLAYLKEGLSTVNIGQKPVEMGELSLRVLHMLSQGQTVPEVINTGVNICRQASAETCTR
ncbi:substrate-binding domain-containing protein [Thalassomonas viridans]|uniref:Substrate-binding domain-containing protein n=1 Tax=Thalassomonas viridans TaxID=137584 RepID=A0AAE9Z031_9GAMM|nr:substrate-binding domain-containing protein [Thalassomonas viridans]WDE03757.1 substrate-binding domain-containing protein [Thalassomonas viridans]